MRFIASDSTTIVEYLDGGSLIEAALDDIILYDLANPDGVEEAPMQAIEVYPNPATDEAVSTGWWAWHGVRLINALGQTVQALTSDAQGRVAVQLNAVEPGMYWLSGRDVNGMLRSAPLQVVRP